MSNWANRTGGVSGGWRAAFGALLVWAVLIVTARGEEWPPYPQYQYSHVVLDLVHSPLMGRLGVKRLKDEAPVAYGREWFPEGPYIDVVRIDTLVQDPLGTYLLYYTAHAHVGCGLAYADNLNGPWTFLDTLLWDDGAAVDVHWLEESQQFAVYYHPSNSHSVMRFSTDGVTWSEKQEIAKGSDLYGDGSTFFYTKVFEHTCPSLDNRYIMLWRAEARQEYENGRWNNATCLMYSNDGIDWTFFPHIIHHDNYPLGTNFLKWGDTYLLMNWGYGYCSKRLVPGGPNMLIYETPADLAQQRGSCVRDPGGEWRYICENTMELIEAEPGCGYTIDADSGKGPLEGKHIIEGDTLYHFCVAWNDSAPSEELGWGKNWENGQIALWKAPVPGSSVAVGPSASEPTKRPLHAGSAAGLAVRLCDRQVSGLTGRGAPAIYSLRGKLIGTKSGVSGRGVVVYRRESNAAP